MDENPYRAPQRWTHPDADDVRPLVIAPLLTALLLFIVVPLVTMLLLLEWWL